MGLSVSDRGAIIATFRFVEVRLMETAASWTPTTPEMEVKVLLGRHIWDFAQHADALGRRAFELRLPLQHSLRPASSYVELLDEVRGLEGTAERLSGFYDVLLTGLQGRYAEFLRETDPILDGPSVVVVERILQDSRRQTAEAEEVRRELGLPPRGLESLRAREGSLRRLVAS